MNGPAGECPRRKWRSQRQQLRLIFLIKEKNYERAESMEDILDDFNDNLKNVKKIYGSISDAITSNQGGKETVVKIS